MAAPVIIVTEVSCGIGRAIAEELLEEPVMSKTVIQHVISRLREIGVKDDFGVAGDFPFPSDDAVCAGADPKELVRIVAVRSAKDRPFAERKATWILDQRRPSGHALDRQVRRAVRLTCTCSARIGMPGSGR
jgi:hypothetical protein